MKQGFTLLELSIVLVIIGLIIGGVTAGQSLIRSAELNSVINKVNEYKVAINTFKLKYNQLPGDMNNASSYWPTDCVDGGSGLTLNACDGDNDGIIAARSEKRRFHQHLHLSEILLGNGNPDICNNALGFLTITECNSKILNTIIDVHTTPYSNFVTNTGTAIRGDTANAIQMSAQSGILLETELANMDSKTDDGIASSGSFGLYTDESDGGCLNTDHSDYDLTDSGDFADCTIVLTDSF